MNNTSLNFTVRAANMTELETEANKRAESLAGNGWALCPVRGVEKGARARQVDKEYRTMMDPDQYEVEGQFIAYYVRSAV